MRLRHCFLLVACFGFSALLLHGCNSKTEDALPAVNQVQIASLPVDDCQRWNEYFDSLSEEAKKSFQKEGIYVVSSGYILSEDLVKDCRLRLEIGRFIWEGVRENISETQRDFGAQNSKLIVQVLDKIWNSPNFSSDGMHHEKYLLLMSDRGIKDEDITPFIGQLVKVEGIYSPELGQEAEIFYILFDRPLPVLAPVILEKLKQEEKEKDLTGQIYALFLLRRDTAEKKYLVKMKEIIGNPNLNGTARTVLKKIIVMIEKGEKVEFDYLDDFAYAVVNNESLLK